MPVTLEIICHTASYSPPIYGFVLELHTAMLLLFVAMPSLLLARIVFLCVKHEMLRKRTVVCAESYTLYYFSE